MDNTDHKNFTSNSLVAIPVLFSIMLGQPNYQENLIGKKNNTQMDNREVFCQLPNQNITLEESQMDILVSFVSKLVNESKDLDPEIVDMVNRNFEELLLKL